MTSWDKQGRRRAWAALRRAGLRAVVTKALAGGLAAYLCVRERETLRLRSNCLVASRAATACSCCRSGSPAASREAACLGQDSPEARMLPRAAPRPGPGACHPRSSLRCPRPSRHRACRGEGLKIGGSPDLDASYATRCRGGSFEFRTSALSPGLLRGLIRMPGC